MVSNPRTQGRYVLKCPFCGREVRQNRGWAGMFYDGYCNNCDMPVVNARRVNTRREVKSQAGETTR